uniref:ATP synthase subunit a n=1 Tax=Penthimia melanocephala TaxID=2777567 RepID=A0A7L8UWN5_9HEMI|nr:ATP synthase F0 subunit 6 [Penthimia melanocephala]QOG08901.1 ATP synthase F0 subunit 6 [Penthimia melanocephala]
MNNLFSVFDPSTGLFSMNWMSTITFTTLPLSFWTLKTKTNMIINNMLLSLSNEIKMLTKTKKLSIIMVSMFMLILINNLMGLFPYIFTSTAHLSCSLGMALTLWLSMMIYGWTKKTNSMFCHLVPIGTPSMLMPFMVMIETISNIIRPGSLAVRLSANMIAGHILMTLLGNNSTGTMMMFIMWLFMGLMMFEMAVAFIQSYVFMTLSTLYSSEI